MSVLLGGLIGLDSFEMQAFMAAGGHRGPEIDDGTQWKFFHLWTHDARGEHINHPLPYAIAMVPVLRRKRYQNLMVLLAFSTRLRNPWITRRIFSISHLY